MKLHAALLSPAFSAPLLAFLLAGASSAQTVQNETQKFGASDAAQNDEFSSGIALDGDRMVVGAGRADTSPSSTSNEGAVYVFEFDGTSWVEQDILVASDKAAGDEFGADVALQGDRFVSGARLHDLTTGGNEGAAYVFEFDGTQWGEIQELNASDAGPGDNFSQDLRIEGDFVFSTSQFNDAPASTLGDEGAVYVFHDDGTSYSETQKLTASDAAEGDRFGSALDVDGTRAVIGALNEGDVTFTGAGAAYVFDFDGTNWVETAKLTPSTRHNGQNFGSSIAVDGDRIAVGADMGNNLGGTPTTGSVWIFEFNGSSWVETARLEAGDGATGDQFGASCWLQGDFLVAGAPIENAKGAGSGSAYLFELNGAVWSERAKLVASNGAAGDNLGLEVVVQGENVITSSRVAKPGVGTKVGGVYVFDTSTNAGAMHADFLADRRTGVTPAAIDFLDASVGDAATWSWDFGDGGVSSAQNPTHTYNAFGTFDVSLSVTGALGSDSTTKTGFVVIDPLPGSATVRNGSGVNPLVYQPLNAPVLGGIYSATVDASGHPGAGLTAIVAYDLPLAGFPTPFGELLIGLEPFGGAFGYSTIANSFGGIAQHDIAAPTDIVFVGIEFSSQAVILGGAGPELTNAVDLVLGY